MHDTLFSSRYELIANPLLNALVWIMGILSVGGNVVELQICNGCVRVALR